jgi:hypothetical protein
MRTPEQRTPEQEALLRELLYLLPNLAVDYRQMAKQLADFRPTEVFNLSFRCEKANRVLSIVQDIAIESEASNAARVSDSRLRTFAEGSEQCSSTSIRSLRGPAIGPRLKNGQFFSHRSMF